MRTAQGMDLTAPMMPMMPENKTLPLPDQKITKLSPTAMLKSPARTQKATSELEKGWRFNQAVAQGKEMKGRGWR